MMKYAQFLLVNVLLTFLTSSIQAQKVLPDFSVRELTKGKIQISWNNAYTNCIQLAIQRSSDSSKDFRTIFSSLSPELPANGYVDSKIFPYKKRYYRIFYVLSNGTYYFSTPLSVETNNTFLENPDKSINIDKKALPYLNAMEMEYAKKPIKIYIKKSEVFRLTKAEYLSFRDSINHKTKDALHKISDQSIEWRPSKLNIEKGKLTIVSKKESVIAKLGKTDFTKFKDSIKTQTKDTLKAIDQWRMQIYPFQQKDLLYLFIYKMDSLIAKMEWMNYKKFKDSINAKTKDTLINIDMNHLKIHPYIPRYVWRPSAYVFTNLKGNVSIQIPLVKQHRYRIVFFDETGLEIFQIKLVKEQDLILDKTNFMHSGWFTFELYENDKLKEKDKFFLAKD